jgi:hypothetical protein
VALHLNRRQPQSSGREISSAKIIGKKRVAPAKMRIAGGNISPKSTVKSDRLQRFYEKHP